ncbi:MAG: alpha/beta hydrolase [Alphaproteobacteria bacterium]|nr:alpha/beta hydrolase [Alphaproteobacteria bacterium]
MKKILITLLMACLCGCSAKNVLTDYRFQTQTVPPFVVASWFKVDAVGQPIRIYIEGDGNAFDGRGYPTDNPTPKSTFLREIAANDPNPNVVYLGRPCQYLQAGACSESVWTNGRFSEEVIGSMEKAVFNLMKKARASKAILIGYSGGAQIAGQIAVRNPEKISYIITLAGVLDHKAWSDYHGDEPLTQSLNLADKKSDFDKIPQHHFVGAKDDVVPPELTQEFIASDDKITVVPKASHNKGYEKIMTTLYQMGMAK